LHIADLKRNKNPDANMFAIQDSWNFELDLENLYLDDIICTHFLKI
jgi:hypothetical protein